MQQHRPTYEVKVFLHMNLLYELIKYVKRNRGYYMAARRYKWFLFECWKIFHSFAALLVKYFFFHTRREILYLQRPCNVLFIIETPMKYQTISLSLLFWCEMHDLSCCHSNGDIFTCEDIKFSKKLTWYFINDYIINSCLCHFDCRKYQWYDPCHCWHQNCKLLQLLRDSEAFTFLSRATLLLKSLRFPDFSFFTFNPFGNSLAGVSLPSPQPQGLL